MVTADGTTVPYVAAVPSAPADRLTARVPVRSATQADEIVERIRATFARRPEAVAALAAEDAAVAKLVELYPAVVPVLVTDPFHALIRSISAQQVNLRWAATVRRRLGERYGHRHEIGDTYVYALDPNRLAAATLEELRAIQLTTAKSRSVIAVAEAATTGYLDRDRLATMDDATLIAHLTALPGIGLWSAEWFVARTLGRPRVVAGDLGVRKAIGRMYRPNTLPSEQDVRQMTAQWGDAATFVQNLALYDLAVRPGP